MLPSLVLDAIARSPCASKLVGLDWFPVSEANLMSFFTMLYAVQGVEHIEVGETLDLCVLSSASLLPPPPNVTRLTPWTPLRPFLLQDVLVQSDGRTARGPAEAAYARHQWRRDLNLVSATNG